MLSCIRDQGCHAARPRGALPPRSSWLWKGALPTRVNGDTHWSGAALFLTGTCQVSACTYVHMLWARRITPVLRIKKKLHKPGQQHTHNMHLVCTCVGKRLVLPHSFRHCTVAPTEPPQTQKPQNKEKNIKVILTILFSKKKPQTPSGQISRRREGGEEGGEGKRK